VNWTSVGGKVSGTPYPLNTNFSATIYNGVFEAVVGPTASVGASGQATWQDGDFTYAGTFSINGIASGTWTILSPDGDGGTVTGSGTWTATRQ
jgi:hypothetical protein